MYFSLPGSAVSKFTEHDIGFKWNNFYNEDGE